MQKIAILLAALAGIGFVLIAAHAVLTRSAAPEEYETMAKIASRLEESSAGPARKYYSLTKEGRKVMETMNDYMGEFNRSVTRLRKKGA